MVEGGLRGDAFAGVVPEHALQQVDACRVEVEVVDHVLERRGDPVGEALLVVLQLRDARPVVFVGRAADAEDAVELVDLGVACEERVLGDQLDEDDAHRPHVDRRGVLDRAEEDFRRAVPQRGHFLGVGPVRDAEGPREAEVRDLDLAF